MKQLLSQLLSNFLLLTSDTNTHAVAHQYLSIIILILQTQVLTVTKTFKPRFKNLFSLYSLMFNNGFVNSKSSSVMLLSIDWTEINSWRTTERLQCPCNNWGVQNRNSSISSAKCPTEMNYKYSPEWKVNKTKPENARKWENKKKKKTKIKTKWIHIHDDNSCFMLIIPYNIQ